MIYRKLTNREKQIFVACIFVLVIAFSYQGVYLPLNQQRSEIDGKIKVAEKLLKKSIRTINQGKAYESSYEKIMGKLRQSATDEEAMSMMLSEVEQVANENKMNIVQMKPQGLKKLDFYNNLSVTLSINGSLTEIVRFLHTLQNDDHLFIVDELRFDKVSPRNSDLKCMIILSKVLIP